MLKRKRIFNFKKDVSQLEDESEYKTGNKVEIAKLVTAGTIFRDEENYEDAISCYDKALEIDQNDPLALSNKGGALIEMKKYDDALPLLDKAIEMKPEFADAFYNKAAGMAMTGNIEEALSCLTNAVKINPKFAEMAKNDNDFLYIKELPGFSAIVD